MKEVRMRESQLRNRVRMMLLESPESFDLGYYAHPTEFNEPFKGIMTSRAEVQAAIGEQIGKLTRAGIDTGKLQKELEKLNKADLSDENLSKISSKAFGRAIILLSTYKSGFTPLTRSESSSIIVNKVYDNEESYRDFFKDMAAAVGKPATIDELRGFFDSAFRGRDVRTLQGGESVGSPSAAGSSTTSSSTPTSAGLAQSIAGIDPAPGQGSMAPMADAVAEAGAAQNITSQNAVRLVSYGNSILEGADYGIDTIRALVQPSTGGDFQIEPGAFATGGGSFKDNFCQSIHDAYFLITPDERTVGASDDEKRVRQVVAAIRYASIVNEGNEKQVKISAGLAIALSSLGYAGVKSATPARTGGGKKPGEGYIRRSGRIIIEKWQAANMAIDIAGEKYPKAKEAIETAAKEIEASVEKDTATFEQYKQTAEALAADIAEIQVMDRKLEGLGETLTEANAAVATALARYQGIPVRSSPEAVSTSGASSEFRPGLSPEPAETPTEPSEFDISATAGGDVSVSSGGRAGSRQQVAAAQARRLDAQAKKLESEAGKVEGETAADASKVLAEARRAAQEAEAAVIDQIKAIKLINAKIAASKVVAQSSEPLAPGQDRQLYMEDLRMRLAEAQKNAEDLRAKLEETKKFLSDPAADKSAKAWDYAKNNNSLPPSIQSYIPLTGVRQYLYFALASGAVLTVAYVVGDVIISNLSSSDDPSNITQSILTQDDATLLLQDSSLIPGASDTTDLYQEMTNILDDRRGAMWIVGIFRKSKKNITNIEAEDMYKDITNMVKAAEGREPVTATIQRGVVACDKILGNVEHKSAAPVMPAQGSEPARRVVPKVTPRQD
jgi:hypothetical protein